MKAIIKWPGGKTVIENCELGDQRVADELARLARAGVTKGVIVEFEDDFL